VSALNGDAYDTQMEVGGKDLKFKNSVFFIPSDEILTSKADGCQFQQWNLLLST